MPRHLTLKICKTTRRGRTMYYIYVPAYLSATGKSCTRLFARKADADHYRSELFAAWKSSEEKPLSPAQQADARAAMRMLEKANIALSLTDAIEQALPVLRHANGLTAADLITQFTEVKSPTWRERTALNFRHASRMFLDTFADKPLNTIMPDAIAAWLVSTFSTETSRAHAQRTLSPAFSYAVRQGLMQENPFSRIERNRTTREDAIDILTPEEACTLMHTAPADCIPAYAILLFAGVRPRELTRLTWGDIRDGYIHIGAKVAKVRQARNIEIEPTLAAWLATTGTHQPDATIIPSNWKRKDQATRSAAGIANRPDVCRHSYATYHLAAHGSVDQLKLNLGHSRSSDTLFIHYRAAATPETAARYWSITPSFCNFSK